MVHGARSIKPDELGSSRSPLRLSEIREQNEKTELLGSLLSKIRKTLGLWEGRELSPSRREEEEQNALSNVRLILL